MWSVESTKGFVPPFSNIVVISNKGHFHKTLTWIFKFGCFSWYHTHILEKKKVRSPNAELNAKSNVTYFKSQKRKTRKLVCPFLIAPFHFETNLIINNGFSFIRDNLGQLGNSLESVRSSKISCFRQKKFFELSQLSPKGKPLWQKE